MSETTTQEPLALSPLEDEPKIENLPEPIPLTPEQLAAQAEADERDRQRQREWALVVQALNDNSLAVFRAMRRFRNEAEQEQVERVRIPSSWGRLMLSPAFISKGYGCTMGDQRSRPMSESAATLIGSNTKVARTRVAEQAAALGWGALDPFGCNWNRSFSDIDQADLCGLIGGNRPVDLSAGAAIIETWTGARQSDRRKHGELDGVPARNLAP